MRITIAILTISLGFISCRKDKLEGDKEIFIGKWNWAFTDHEYYLCLGMPQYETLTPDSEGTGYSMEFFKNGIVKFYNRSAVIDRNRLVFDGFLNHESGFINDCYLFYCDLNNIEDDDYYRMYGFINSDTIVLQRGFPYRDSEQGCESHISYFIKE